MVNVIFPDIPRLHVPRSHETVQKPKNRAQNTQNRSSSGINNNLIWGAEIAHAQLLVLGQRSSRAPAHTVTPLAVLLLWAPHPTPDPKLTITPMAVLEIHRLIA